MLGLYGGMYKKMIDLNLFRCKVLVWLVLLYYDTIPWVKMVICFNRICELRLPKSRADMHQQKLGKP